MFVQVIQGKVTDAAQLRRAVEQWYEELAPGAVGWLGSTGGVTEDGRFVAIVRFESAEAARRNSERPEQDRWWARTAELFDGEATFRDSSDVIVDVAGDPDPAGFVQVMQGRGSDPDRARELMAQDAGKWAEFRPDVVGSVTVGHQGGAYTMACTSPPRRPPGRASARRCRPSCGADGGAGQAQRRGAGVLRPTDPWMHSPR